MARVRKYLNFLNGWEQVNTAAEANAADVPHMEPMRVKLQALLEQARSLSAQQGALTSSKQETSKALRKLIRKGQKLVDFMRTGAVEHYGPDSEKLVEFGMQPFRGRSKAAAKPPDKPAPQTPEAPTSTPTPELTK
jgi:hypothetical protein